MSMRTRSGRNVLAFSTASTPSLASPQTSHPARDDSRERTPCRTTCWSSTIRMRKGCMACFKFADPPGIQNRSAEFGYVKAAASYRKYRIFQDSIQPLPDGPIAGRFSVDFGSRHSAQQNCCSGVGRVIGNRGRNGNWGYACGGRRRRRERSRDRPLRRRNLRHEVFFRR